MKCVSEPQVYIYVTFKNVSYNIVPGYVFIDGLTYLYAQVVKRQT